MSRLRPLLLVSIIALTASCRGLGAPSAQTSPSGTAGGSAPEVPGSPDPTDAPGPTATPPGPSVAEGLAFVREVDGVTQVFVVQPDGSARQVSNLAADASVAAVRPLWSPDRAKIVFRPRAIGSGPDPQLWVVMPDGTGQRPLATVGEFIGWSPDAASLLYQDSTLTTDTTGRAARIWLLDVASGDGRVLAEGDVPQWLPDGEHFSYVPVRSGPGGDTVPFVVAGLDGDAPVPLVDARFISWSPDGTALLVEQPDGLYLAEPDASGARFLVVGGPAAWSPDGTRIVYQYDHDADAQPIIGVVDRSGAVLWSGRVGGDPTWSPDGRKLAVEVGYPYPSIEILDAATGQLLWQLDGQDPAW